MRQARGIQAAALALAAVAAVTPVAASTVTLVGSEFDVVYDPSQLGLFNAPVLVNDVLYFTPTAFTDSSMNGQGLTSTSSTASGIQIIANPGWQLTTLQVAAQGDYQMRGAGSYVNVSGQLIANPGGSTQTTVSLALNPGLPLTLNDGLVHNWAGSSTLNQGLPDDAATASVLPTTDSLTIQLSNTLQAYTDPAGSGPQSAFIQEKFAGLQLYIDPVPVPLPATIWLFVTGLALLGVLVYSRGRTDSARGY